MVRIALNAGHGLYTQGKETSSALNPVVTKEWTLNARVVEKVIKKLADYEGCEILRIDDPTGKIDIPLAERTTKANNWMADLWLGFHHNAGVRGGRGGGIVVFRYNNSPPEKAKLNGELQQRLYNHLAIQTGLVGNRHTPLAVANFHELRETNMPALLMELGFMDSKTDLPIILTDAYAEKCADGVVGFLVETYGLKKKVVVVPPVKDYVLPDGKFFRVVVGSYQSRNNAEEVQRRLKEAGFDSFLTIFEKV